METNMQQAGGPRRHASLEAIPLDPEEMSKAPMYFKKVSFI